MTMDVNDEHVGYSSDEEDDFTDAYDEDKDSNDFEIEWTNDMIEDKNSDNKNIKPDVEEEKQSRLTKIQDDASIKQKFRKEKIGELLRSKGFVWIATCHNVMGEWQQVRKHFLSTKPGNFINFFFRQVTLLNWKLKLLGCVKLERPGWGLLQRIL